MSDDIDPALRRVLDVWRLPGSVATVDDRRTGPGDLLDRVEAMVRPALLAGHFGSSVTRMLAGLQYHLGGAEDTRQLADLARLTSDDRVLDVCCYLGGPALQIATTHGCRVTGVDLDPRVVAAASRIAELAGLAHLLRYQVADAARLPFADGSFTVVWNQCSLDSDEGWLRELDRVLAPGGRFALTFQSRGVDDRRWTIAELTELVGGLGYTVTSADDLTLRDAEIGWRALDAELAAREPEYAAALGADWVARAHEELRREADRMVRGEYGNARLVAVKGPGDGDRALAPGRSGEASDRPGTAGRTSPAGSEPTGGSVAGTKPRHRTLAQWESEIEASIRGAIASGAFDDLPGAGKPFAWDTAHDDPESWLAGHVLKSAGFAPDWIERGREIRAEREALESERRTALAWCAEQLRAAAAAPPDEREDRRASVAAVAETRAAAVAARAARLNRAIDSHNVAAPAPAAMATVPGDRWAAEIREAGGIAAG